MVLKCSLDLWPWTRILTDSEFFFYFGFRVFSCLKSYFFRTTTRLCHGRLKLSQTTFLSIKLELHAVEYQNSCLMLKWFHNFAFVEYVWGWLFLAATGTYRFVCYWVAAFCFPATGTTYVHSYFNFESSCLLV